MGLEGMLLEGYPLSWRINGLVPDGRSALAGYLIGGISFARLIAARVIPEKDISKVELNVPGTETTFVMDTVSATTMRVHAGTRFGCLTAVLDMLKVAGPDLGMMALVPGMPYHLILAAAAVVGHNWPVYYGSRVDAVSLP